MLDGNRITRALTLAHAEIERLRAGEGNPNHADDGKFASHPGAHGKHFAKRQRRKARRQAKLKEMHKAGKADLAAVRKTHKGERKDLLKEHKAERKSLPKDWRADVKTHNKTVKEDHADLRAQHRTERREMVASQRTERTETAKQHHAEHRDQQQTHAREARQSRKDVEAFSSKEKLEAKHSAERAEHAKSVSTVMETAPKVQAKELDIQAAKGASAGKIALMKKGHAAQNEEMYKNISKRGEALEAKHSAEKREQSEHGNAKRVEAHKAMEERHAGEKKGLAEEHAGRKADLDAEVGDLRASHAEERKSLRGEHNEARKNLRDEYKTRKEDQRSDHAEQRKDLRDTQREERRDEVNRIKDDLRDEFPKRKRQKSGDARSGLSGAIPLGDSPDSREIGIARAFAPTRTSKASSAEAILRYCLRQRGWTRAYREGELTDFQRLKLLGDMREYGRAWLRHEAAELFAAYGRHDEPDSVVGRGVDCGVDSGVSGGIFGGVDSASQILGRHDEPTRDRSIAGGDTDETSDGSRQGLAGGNALLGATHGRDHEPTTRTAGVDRETAVGHLPGHQEDSGEGGGVSRGAGGDPGWSVRTAEGVDDDNLLVDRDGLSHAALGLVNGGLDRALGAAIKHHVSRFFRRAKQFTRELILAGTLALSEPKPLDAEDLDQVNRQAVEQERYFDAFEAEVNALPPPELVPDLGLNQVTIIAPPSMSMPQFIARAEQYGSSVWGAAQEVARAQVIRGREYIEERRVHGMLKDDMCSICREAVAMGWQPIGTLPAIGDSECLSSCHCFFKWRDAEGKEKSQVRKMRKKGGTRIRRPVVQEA